MNKIVVMTALCAAACLPCPAQQAMVVVSHSDPDGIVEPGQTVEITTTVSWTSAYVLSFSLIKGDVRASADVGLAANPRFPYSSYGTNQVQVINPGAAAAGSVVEIEIASGDVGWIVWSIPIPWPWNVSSGIEVHRFDWTAPSTPGVVAFDFVPEPSYPEPWFGVWPMTWPLTTTLPTTFVGASLTVIPAPGAGAALMLGLAGASLRRRRSAHSSVFNRCAASS